MAIRNQLEIDVIISNGQDTLGDLALKIVNEKNSGRYDARAHEDKCYRLILLDNYLRAIIDPDDEGIKPYYSLPENEVKFNKMLDAIYKLSDIFDIPGIPITGRRRQPLIFDKVGVQGPAGTPGSNGTDADIEVISDPDYDNMSVITLFPLGVKTVKLGYAPYIAPQDSIAIQGSKIIQIGIVIPILTVVVTSIKGRELITSRTITTPAGISLSNPGINDPGPQSENIFKNNVSVTTTFTVNVQDGRSSVNASDVITFVYPFLFGNTETDTIDYYQDLSKLIATKSDKQVTFNGTIDYFWFGYVASYGSISKILDQNGFDVTAEWEEVTVGVNSANLDNNWSGVSFKFMKTKLKTTINNSLYTFKF